MLQILKTYGKVRIYALFTVAAIAFGVGLGFLLTNINQRLAEGDEHLRKIVEIKEGEVDPAVWGKNFPRHYDSFMKTQLNNERTAFGGSAQFSKLEEKPFLKKAWAGYPFALDYNEDRGHYYSAIDQQKTKRVTERNQPGTCANCHTGDFTKLMQTMSWETMNKTPLKELVSKGHISKNGITCADCHEPQTMQLRITRPALVNALQQKGVDLSTATRQEMRTYVCAQCHVEYYFKGEEKTLVFPWSKGTSVEAILEHYDNSDHIDWVHELTKGPMLKMQHPEYELYTNSTHYKSGVACADCHMPYTREGGVKVSDHNLRSPLSNINNACQTCHKIPEADLKERVLVIQNRTRDMMKAAEAGLSDAIDAIVAAIAAGATDAALAPARKLHRAAQMRWDFVDAENSMGFHNPQEAVRVLGHAADLARQAQLSAEQARHRKNLERKP